MNDQFINYEAEHAQLSDKLDAAKQHVEELVQTQRQLKVSESALFSTDRMTFFGRSLDLAPI